VGERLGTRIALAPERADASHARPVATVAVFVAAVYIFS
jgi:hypothetical protein